MRVDGRRRNSRPATELYRERILRLGEDIVRRQGLAGLTMAALGRVLRMQPPTIQRFVRDLDEVRDAVIAKAQAELVELTEGMIGALRGRPALQALFEAQRLFAQAQPNMYEAALLRPTRPEASGAHEKDALTELECEVLRVCGATGVQAERLAWCLRAAVHGAIRLEAGDRRLRQKDLDENFEVLLNIIDAAVGSARDLIRTPVLYAVP